jgi:hypothetical protein
MSSFAALTPPVVAEVYEEPVVATEAVVDEDAVVQVRTRCSMTTLCLSVVLASVSPAVRVW